MGIPRAPWVPVGGFEVRKKIFIISENIAKQEGILRGELQRALDLAKKVATHAKALPATEKDLFIAGLEEALAKEAKESLGEHLEPLPPPEKKAKATLPPLPGPDYAPGGEAGPSEGVAPEPLPAAASQEVLDAEAFSLEDWAEKVFELLTEERKVIVSEIFLTGIGLCSKCRWKHGYHQCDYHKAVRYWRNFEMGKGFKEGYQWKGRGKGKSFGGGFLEEALNEEHLCITLYIYSANRWGYIHIYIYI